MRNPSVQALLQVLFAASLLGCYPKAGEIQPKGGPDASTSGDVDAPVSSTPDAAGASDVGLDVGGVPVAAGLTDLSPPADRCRFYAQAFCARFAECSPNWFAVQYLTMETCKEREGLGCQLTADLPGSTYPNVECGKGFAEFSCALLSDQRMPSKCYAPGNNLEGQPCAAETQCQGRRCAFQASAGCGQCTRRGTLGEVCESQADCHPDLACYQNKCALLSSIGKPCGTSPCEPGLRCGADSLCTQFAAEAQDCTISTDCDVYGGFLCGSKTKKCVRYSASDSSCGVNEDGSFLFCGAAKTCGSGACTPAANLGEPCDSDNGPDCLWPTFCHSTTRTCTMPTLDSTCGVIAPISGPPNNAAAEISGAVIGYPNQNNELYRKKLTAVLLEPRLSGVTLGPVWGLGAPGSPSMYLPIPVTNNGTGTLCAMNGSFTVLDATGKALATNKAFILTGSVQRIDTAWDKYCLKSGETGYILNIAQGTSQNDVFANATDVQIALNASQSGAENAVRVTPIRYKTDVTEQRATIEVTIMNTGTVSAVLADAPKFLLLDDIGPIVSGLLAAPTPAQTLAPGETATLTTPAIGGVVHGHGTRLRVFIDLKKP
jgi:hypothetical protein